MTPFLQTLTSYFARGWSLVPIEKGQKSPNLAGWQKLKFTPDNFKEGCNVGLKLTRQITDVDLDTVEALNLADEFLPKTGCTHGRASRPRSHRWYLCENTYKKYVFEGHTLLEIRASKDGRFQTVIPPSQHPSGETLKWDGETMTPVDAETLTKACDTLAAATLLVRKFPPKGRHALALALSGVLLRNHWDPERARHFIRTVYYHGGSDAPDARAKAVDSTLNKLEIGEPTTGIPSMIEILGQAVVDKLVLWLGLTNDDSNDNVSTELELANYVARANPDILHRSSSGCWYLWDTKVWDPTDQKEIYRRIEKAIEILTEDTKRKLSRFATDDKSPAKKALVNTYALCKKVSTSHGIRSIAKLCETRMHCDTTPLDAHANLFNCANGVLNLDTAELIPHDPKLYLTKSSPVAFDLTAKCPKWDAFLKRFVPDEGVREFLQTYLGYSLSGSKNEQVFAVLWGSGSNGKSTFVETVSYVLGDYAKVASDRTFVSSRSETRPDLVLLEGARLVTCSEPKDGYLDEAFVKQITGDKAITARGLYENSRTFAPVYKIVMLCNSEPRIRGADDGIWRRIRLVPFDVAVSDAEAIRDYGAQLKEESMGILQWLYEGYCKWKANGLPAVQKIVERTAEYRQESDILDDFVTECLEYQTEFKEKPRSVYAAYQMWSQNQMQKPLNKTDFASRIRTKGFHKYHSNGIWWKGFKLNAAGRKLAALLSNNA